MTFPLFGWVFITASPKQWIRFFKWASSLQIPVWWWKWLQDALRIVVGHIWDIGGVGILSAFPYSILIHHIRIFLFEYLMKWNKHLSGGNLLIDHYYFLPASAKRRWWLEKWWGKSISLLRFLKLNLPVMVLYKEQTKVSKPKIRSELFYSIEDPEMNGSFFHNSRRSSRFSSDWARASS